MTAIAVADISIRERTPEFLVIDFLSPERCIGAAVPEKI
jgi:hypothetical protein